MEATYDIVGGNCNPKNFLAFAKDVSIVFTVAKHNKYHTNKNRNGGKLT
jgi:hypothetical protein